MAISRYWRLVGLRTPANGALELSEARLYEGGVAADASATLTATIAPGSGALSALRDGLTAAVVSWGYSSYSQPGFALVWDFGAGAGLEYPVLVLGSGRTEAAYVSDVVIQQSIDGLEWQVGKANFNLTYPGAYSVGAVATPGSDSNFSAVALLLPCDGADGATTFTDSSFGPASIVATGAVALTTAQSKFGGASMQVTAKTARLDVNKVVDLRGTYTIEAWVRGTAAVAGDANNLISSGDHVLAQRHVVDWYAPTASTIVGRVAGPNNTIIFTTPGQPYVLGQWAHIAWVNNVDDGTFKIFINGALAGSRPVVPLFNASVFQIARNSAAWAEPPYQMDDIRVTVGVARYTSAFAVPTVAHSYFSKGSGVIGRSAQTVAVPSEHLRPAIPLPTTTAQGHLREYPFFDVYHGGIGLIIGTVKEKSLPANVPLARKVWLMDEASGMVVRETWSDATTGAYEFRGVKQGVKYTVLAYDYTGLYRAVIADAQVPEAMP